MNAFFSFDLFVVYLPECKQQLITDIINADARYCTLEIWAVVLLLSESCAVINDQNVILHGFLLQIIYTKFFWVKQSNVNNVNITWMIKMMTDTK